MKKIIQLGILLLVAMVMSCEEAEPIQNPVACFSIHEMNIYAGDEVSIHNCSEAKNTFLLIDGEPVGEIGEGSQKYYTFREAKTYTVKVVAYNRTLRDEYSEQVIVRANGGTTPIVTTTDIYNETANSMVVSGSVVSSDNIVDKGVFYNYTNTVNEIVNAGGVSANAGEGSFELKIDGLTPDSPIFAVAYALTQGGDYYFGKVLESRTTLNVNIVLGDHSNLTTNSVDFTLNISADNNLSIGANGVVVSEYEKPEIGDGFSDFVAFGSGIGSFSNQINNLKPETYYYARGVVDVNGTLVYSNQIDFKTLATSGGELIKANSIQVNFTNNRPIIDGVIDAMWNDIPAYVINQPMLDEIVSFNREASFKTVWDNDYIYLLVEVPDDDFYPFGETLLQSYEADKPELYFDVNAIKQDGLGAIEQGLGHYQFAPAFNEGLVIVDGEWEYGVDNNEEGYWVEYSIPFTALVDIDGLVLNPYLRRTIGFDITLIDLDEVGKGESTENRQRVNWVNDGLGGESWTTLDYSGDFNFVGGTEPPPSNKVIFKEDFESTTEFEDINLSGWVNYLDVGTMLWQSGSFGGNLFAQFSALESNEENSAWLISPLINLDESVNEEFTFDVKVGFFNEPNLYVVISSDYDGSDMTTANWFDITEFFNIPNFPNDGYGDFVSAGTYDLSVFSGSVSLGFVYAGVASDTTKLRTAYQIDNFIVREKP